MKAAIPGMLGVLAILFCGAMEPPAGAKPAPVVHKIIIEKMAFGPPPVHVHVGDIVEWTNKDIFRHTATSAEKMFDLDIAPDATASFTVSRAGNFPYSCKYHPGMKSVLIVEK